MISAESEEKQRWKANSETERSLKTEEDQNSPDKAKNIPGKNVHGSERMPYVKCFKRDLAGKNPFFGLLWGLNWRALEKILKKIKKSFEKVLTNSEKRDNIYLADAEKSQ